MVSSTRSSAPVRPSSIPAAGRASAAAENVKAGDLNASVVRDPHPELNGSTPNATGTASHWRYHYQHAQDNLPGGFRGVVDIEDFSDLDFFRQYERDPRIHTLSNATLTGKGERRQAAALQTAYSLRT